MLVYGKVMTVRSMVRRQMIVFLIVLLIAAGMVFATWKDELFIVFTNPEQISPQPAYVWSLVGQIFILLIAALLIHGTLIAAKDDYIKRKNAMMTQSAPPHLEMSIDEKKLSPKQAIVAAYITRNFRFHSKIGDSESAPDVYVEIAPVRPSGMALLNGAVIYNNGTVSQFSVALLYADDYWVLGDAEKVSRRGKGRGVLLKTALQDTAIKQLVSIHDYVLGVGLASSLRTNEAEFNEKIAIARGYNIAQALVNLKYKEIERIRPVSFGYAKVAPDLPAFEPRQRALMIVGINASRDVILDDVMVAAARIVRLEGVDFRDYSSGGEEFIEIRRPLHLNGQYISPKEVGKIENRTGSSETILPAVERKS